MDWEDDLDCFQFDNQTDFKDLDFSNCSFWNNTDKLADHLDAPAGEIGTSLDPRTNDCNYMIP